jgi:predicted helicase
VVIGNPPYSGESANKGDWILSLLDDYKKEPGGIDRLNEKNPKWINDDYVKFIRYAQLFVERAGSGIVAYINNHSFLDNPTFRGMRWNLLKSFDKIYIIDLHGNAKKKETAPDGSKDENVFDIQQGVSVNIFVKNNKEEITTELHGGKESLKLADVYHYDLYGMRSDKYEFLFEQKINSVKWENIIISHPQYFFKKKEFNNFTRYNDGFFVKELFILNGIGVTTAHDEFVIANTKTTLLEKFNKFKNSKPERDLYKQFSVKEKQGWDIIKGWENLQKVTNLSSYIKPMLYHHPFDFRYIFYEDKLVWRTVRKIMQHLYNGNNIALVTCRQSITDKWAHVSITNQIVDDSYISNRTKERGYVFPLYLYSGKKCRPNLNPKIINEIEQKLNLAFIPENKDSNPLCSSMVNLKEAFTPLDLFDYIYAVLHSPAYRESYREFLKIDFPRIPYPVNTQIFWKLVALGGELQRLHLLEGPEFEGIEADSVHTRKVLVEKVRYSEGRVFVNNDFYFEDVPQTVWEFYIGGYQPAQKWLKDRKGCILKSEDFKHYRKIVLALTETARIMKEIDKVGVV